MTFDQAFERLIGHEGGFSGNPHDRGNWTSGRIGVGELKGTKYGISAMTYPNEDIANLTIDRAKALYKRDFWAASGAEIVPDILKFDVFDTAVNSGPGRALMFLQKAVDVEADGKLGAITMHAIYHMEPARLFARFNGHRLDFLNDNPDQWREFGRGWAQRIADNLKAA